MTFTLRPYHPTDAGAVVQLVNAAAARTSDLTQAVVDAVGQVRLARYVPAQSEKIVALTPENQVVGYAYLTDKEQNIVLEVGGATHPTVWGQGLGTQLLAWAEQRAQAHSAQAPAGVKTVLQTSLLETEQPAVQLFTAAGYRQVREWLHLVIELTAPPQLPPLPAGFTLRPMDLEEDWEAVGPAMDEAFADHWGAITLPPTAALPAEASEPAASSAEAPTDETYSNSPGFCFVLWEADTVAGAVLCNAKLVERADTGRVGSLFVRPRYRRQGVARALMLRAWQAFWEAGLRRIITDTDAESFTSAPKFYTHLGMVGYRREHVYEKEIRSGQEVRRLRAKPLAPGP